MSTLFVRTLREDPADAEVASHRLLVRAGYIRRAAPGIYSWLPLGLRVYKKVEQHHPRGDGRDRCPGAALPGAAPAGAVRGVEPLDRLRRRHLPAPGPQGRRLPARADARGDVHPRREGPVLLLQGPARLALPDPDQVPRRGASSRRPDPGPRVRDEGQLLLRHLRRGARRVVRRAPGRLRQDLRSVRLRLRDRQGHERCDGRLEVRGVPGPQRRRRGHLRALHELRLRRQRRGGATHATRSPRRTTDCPPPTPSRPRTRPPSRPSSTTSTRPSRAPTAGPGPRRTR